MKSGEWELTAQSTMLFTSYTIIVSHMMIPSSSHHAASSLFPHFPFTYPLHIFPPPPHFPSPSILILPSPLSVCLLSTSPIPSPSFFTLPYLPPHSHPLFSPHPPLIVFPPPPPPSVSPPPPPPSTLTSHQEALIELKVAGELFEQLVDAVQPLQEDRAVLVWVEEGATQSKLMAKGQPLTLNQELETLHVVMVM